MRRSAHTDVRRCPPSERDANEADEFSFGYFSLSAQRKVTFKINFRK